MVEVFGRYAGFTALLPAQSIYETNVRVGAINGPHAAERRKEEEETVEYVDRERWEVAAILHRYGVRGDALHLAVAQVRIAHGEAGAVGAELRKTPGISTDEQRKILFGQTAQVVR